MQLRSDPSVNSASFLLHALLQSLTSFLSSVGLPLICFVVWTWANRSGFNEAFVGARDWIGSSGGIVFAAIFAVLAVLNILPRTLAIAMMSRNSLLLSDSKSLFYVVETTRSQTGSENGRPVLRALISGGVLYIVFVGKFWIFQSPMMMALPFFNAQKSVEAIRSDTKLPVLKAASINVLFKKALRSAFFFLGLGSVCLLLFSVIALSPWSGMDSATLVKILQLAILPAFMSFVVIGPIFESATTMAVDHLFAWKRNL